MKNYLVKSLYQVHDPNWMIHDRSHESNMYQNYVDMHQLSVSSFKRHLQGDWELKFFSGNVGSISEAFQATFYNIYKLWSSEPCNIFYTDPDTVARINFTPWNIPEFRMFNFTDPKSYSGKNQWNANFPFFFNAGVRYFPHSMDHKVWQLGLDMAKSWDHSTYDTEQIILNSMLWSQNLRPDYVLLPALAYQAFDLVHRPLWWHDVWNGIAFAESAIIHVHSSRDSKSRLGLMQKMLSEQ